ncbi:hypothetical protein VC83_07226 [Pseudogymnoascus destructans]|uniref:Carbonate dehydratase n=2 Tax=Pseudogymnoascus destructans TaxID=655981 RepID=L8GA33_PSED2|nr:uncharacterized protein VC83_07226 [Pseudogymnoascus destructans]ELR09937.1 carbonate dehydratase [Pseudogymnoascus destructans 20631-21]OAF56542.1 hypothetical protein VC83_07226 [Pseudogymnoascus destructans]
MSEIQKNLVDKNTEYAAAFTKGHLALPPAKKYVVLTCMDARIDPAAAYDALRSIVISQQLLGTNEIILVKHTDYGMLTFDDDIATGLVEKNLSAEAKEALSAFGNDFKTFPQLEDAVRDDVKLLKETPLINDEVPITGWVYEVETGKVRQVV